MTTALEKCRELLPVEFKRAHVLRLARRLGYPDPEARWERWRAEAVNAGAIVPVSDGGHVFRFVKGVLS